MQIPEMFTGESLQRLVHGAIAGVILTVAVGFSWFGYGLGWKLESTVESAATARAEAAVVAAYAPFAREISCGMRPKRTGTGSRVSRPGIGTATS